MFCVLQVVLYDTECGGVPKCLLNLDRRICKSDRNLGIQFTGFRETGHRSTCSSAAREDSDPGIVIILNLNGFLFFFQRIG